jgi:hypothetical protein
VREMMNAVTHGNSTPAGVLITPVTNMQTKTLVHVVLSSETDTDVRNKISYGLHMANEHVESMAIPFPGIRKFETHLWESAQTIAGVIQTFCTDAIRNCNIKTVSVVCNSLLTADVLSVVFRTVLSPSNDSKVQIIPHSEVSVPQTRTDTTVSDGPNTAEVEKNTEQWFSIRRILKQRMYKSKRQFLVEWEDGSTPSWLYRQDVTEDAVNHFHQNRKQKHRKRRQ